MEKAKRIAEARNTKAKRNEERRNTKLKREREEEEVKKRIRDAGMIGVYEKISDKKQKKKEEEEKLAKELKEIKLQRQYLNANKVLYSVFICRL